MAPWKPHLHESAGKKYLSIVEALEADIYGGFIKPGERLPSQRAIAEELQVDLTTVTRAFNEARRRGLVEGNKGRGSFIRGTVEQKLLSDQQGMLDLSMNNPPQPLSANLQQRLPEGIAGLISDQRRMLQLHYQESSGNPADREAAVHWLQSRLSQVDSDRIMIAGGAQSALYAVCRHLLQAGDRLAAAEFTYPGLQAVMTQLGCTIEPLAMDHDGILAEAFELCCQQRRPKALYLIPALDNPTTVTMSLQRRQCIADIAARYGVAIIEDDPYSPLQAKPISSFVQLLPELTWHIGTLSKCVTPALRVAFVVTPSVGDIDALALIMRATYLMAPPLMCALVTRWIYDGTLQEIATAIRLENHQRQKLAAEIFADKNYAAERDGQHLWLTLPEHWRAANFAREAKKRGVVIVPSSSFATGKNSLEAVRVSLGVAADLDALRGALNILARLLERAEMTQAAAVR